jgi:hypothetical protein
VLNIALTRSVVETRSLNLCEHLLQGCFLIDLAANHDSSDFLGIADVLQWVGIQQNQVGNLATLNGAHRIQHTQALGRIVRCSLQGFHG